MTAPHRKTVEATRDDWQTPPAIFQTWNGRFRFTGDAAASPANHLARLFFTEDGGADSQGDGQREPWARLGPRVWCNPPYSTARQWAARCIAASREGQLVVALVPSATDTWYWRELAQRASEVWLSRGRVSFVNPATGIAVPGNPVGSTLFVLSSAPPLSPTLAFFDARDGRPCTRRGEVAFYENPLGV